MFLLDTSVVTELRKARAGKADARLTAWVRSVPAGSLFLSAVVIRELEIGALLAERRDQSRGAILRAWLDEQVLPSFADRILPVDAAVAKRSAALPVHESRPLDALIAATALVHGMTIVTHNPADFEATGVALLNPWDAPR